MTLKIATNRRGEMFVVDRVARDRVHTRGRAGRTTARCVMHDGNPRIFKLDFVNLEDLTHGEIADRLGS